MKKLEITHKYDDIIHLSRPRSGRRAGMSNYDRAAQFSPFAALTGFDATIAETGRRTGHQAILEEDRKAELNEALGWLQAHIASQPEVCITHFQEDDRKEGGAYVTTRGRVRKVDVCGQRVIFSDGTAISLARIYAIEKIGDS